jgi:hypothetical protein
VERIAKVFVEAPTDDEEGEIPDYAIEDYGADYSDDPESEENW